MYSNESSAARVFAELPWVIKCSKISNFGVVFASFAWSNGGWDFFVVVLNSQPKKGSKGGALVDVCLLGNQDSPLGVPARK